MSTIDFFVRTSDEVTTSKTVETGSLSEVKFGIMYSDRELLHKIGTINIIKDVYNLDGNNSNVIGVSAFQNQLTSDNLTSPEENEVIEDNGIYYGAINGVESNGDFRNYGGSVRKIKDSSPVIQYTLSYSSFNPYNTLPN